MFKLDNAIRDYHWGSVSEITDLLGTAGTAGPQAELWLGAHPGCPSKCAETGQPLHELIAQAPAEILGERVNNRYGRLPFLFKVLSASQPLSIQVHPTLAQARAGFVLENSKGVAQDSADRNYKDDNHKPEMLFALTDFVALSGFRDPVSINEDLRLLATELPEAEASTVNKLIKILGGTAPLGASLEFVLTTGEDIKALVLACCQLISATPLLQENVRFAELLRINTIYPGDPGVLVALLLNLVFLKPGDTIALGAGNVHAYLRGLGIEVMANSDNVLRGGLTTKHIDVPELLAVTVAQPSPAPMLQPVHLSESSRVYRPEFDEFQLQVVESSAEDVLTPLELHGAGLVLCTAGEFELVSKTETLRISRGTSVFIAAHEAPVTARSLNAQPSVLFASSAQS